MHEQMTRQERLAAYQTAIDGFTRQLQDVSSGKLDIRMRGADGAYAPMNLQAEVAYLNQHIAVMRDALELAKASPAVSDVVGSPKPSAADSEGRVFYKSDNGDEWRLVTDVGQRRFVRHVPNASSGGNVEVVELEAFRLHAPHSPQNAGLETFLASA